MIDEAHDSGEDVATTRLNASRVRPDETSFDKEVQFLRRQGLASQWQSSRDVEAQALPQYGVRYQGSAIADVNRHEVHDDHRFDSGFLEARTVSQSLSASGATADGQAAASIAGTAGLGNLYATGSAHAATVGDTLGDKAGDGAAGVTLDWSDTLTLKSATLPAGTAGREWTFETRSVSGGSTGPGLGVIGNAIAPAARFKTGLDRSALRAMARHSPDWTIARATEDEAARLRAIVRVPSIALLLARHAQGAAAWRGSQDASRTGSWQTVTRRDSPRSCAVSSAARTFGGAAATDRDASSA